jgi:hypothetical protein
MIVGVRTWAVVVGAAMVLAVGIGTTIGTWQAAPPASPEACIEEAEIRGPSEGRFSCRVGARLEVTPMVGSVAVLARCRCDGARDAGAAP